MWDRAKGPEVADEYELHLSVQRRLASAALLERGLHDTNETERRLTRTLMEGERMRALGVLQAAGAATSKNPLLRFDLGEVLSAQDNHVRSAEVLRDAVAEFPTDPRADRAWLLLAFACGHTGDHVCERNAYHEIQRRQTEEIHRDTPALNLAETEMHQGDLREAIGGYQEALDIAARTSDHQSTRPLAFFGLAVAYDRAGDRFEAEKNAARALESERNLGLRTTVKGPTPETSIVRPSILQTSGVFFVPDYEVNWYLGIEAIAAARKAMSAREALAEWQNADRYYGRWVKGAEKAKVPDRWLPIAKARLAQVKLDLAKAEAVVAKEPPQVHPAAIDQTLHL